MWDKDGISGEERRSSSKMILASQTSNPSVLGDLRPSKQTPSKEQRERCSPSKVPVFEVRSERSLMR